MGHCNCKRHLEGYLNLHSISYGRGRNIKQRHVSRAVEDAEGTERGCARGRRLVTFIKCVSVLFKIKAAEKRNALQLQLKSSSKDAAPPANPVAHCAALSLLLSPSLLLSLFHSAQLVQQCADIYGTKCRRQLADKCLETVMACHGIQCQHATRHGIPACPEAEHSKSVCHLLTFPMSASTLALCPRSCRRICSDTASALLPLPFFVAYFCVPALKSPLRRGSLQLQLG